MVKKSIKIYSRLKNEKPENTISYQVHQQDDCQTITIYMDHPHKFLNHKPQSYKFGFEKVISPEATQEEVFNVIARPVLKSVLNGYNGTIFAYGQTGSGKTYAMTGSSEKYEQRGLIPRSIEEIFRIINETSQKYTICISYLEIYNEIGYDLLNPRQTPNIDDILPIEAGNYAISNNEFVVKNRARKVSLHDYGNGEFHLRNLTIQKVATEQEAMRLLLQGDANRITVETPMNMYSSRSHCIFTIGIAAKNIESGKVRRSKLTLVDLAGSERVCKTNVTGATLHEAKHINLSLHYLEQVVVALSQKKAHVPFRNSMLTYLLKDSLTGNCMAVLLATVTVSNKNIEETIATCKFAQRVADVNIDPEVNEEIDSNYEVQHLQREIDRLRKQVIQQAHINAKEKLTKEEQEKWKKFVNSYLISTKDELPMTPYDVRHVQYCFRLLKQAVKDHEAQKLQIKSAENANKELADQYREQIKIREKEINYLKGLLHVDDEEQILCPPSKQNSLSETDKENVRPSVSSVLSKKDSMTDTTHTSEVYKEDLNSNISASQSKQSMPTNEILSPAQKIAFEVFVKDPENRNEIDFYKKSIDNLYGVATNVALILENCQKNILSLKVKQNVIEDPIEQSKIEEEINNEQIVYRNSLGKLHDIKNETKCHRKALEEAKRHIMLNFKRWYDSIDVSTSQMDSKSHQDNFLKTSKGQASASSSRSHSNSSYDNFKANRKDYNKVDFETQAKHEHLMNNSFSEKTVQKRDNSRSRFVDYILNFDMRSNEMHNDNLCITSKNICRQNSANFNACDNVSHHNSATDRRKIMSAGSERPRSSQSYYSSNIEYHTHSHGQLTPNHLDNNNTHESAINKNVKNNTKNPKIDKKSPRSNFSKANSFAERPQTPTKPFCRSFSYSHNNNFSDIKSKARPKIDLIRNQEEANDTHTSIMRQSDEHEVELNSYVFKPVAREEDSIVNSNVPQVFRAYPLKKAEEAKIMNSRVTEDSQEFKDFMKNIPLTGDQEIDEEIIHFYRTKFNETKTM